MGQSSSRRRQRCPLESDESPSRSSTESSSGTPPGLTGLSPAQTFTLMYDEFEAMTSEKSSEWWAEDHMMEVYSTMSKP
eukprot:1566384-Amphidinium_carterae.1